VATLLGLEHRFREMGLEAMLAAVERKEADAAGAGLTITSERERRMDFTHPFLSSGLGIAVQNDGGGGWLAVSQRLFSAQVPLSPAKSDERERRGAVRC
jgi:ABC-type amino acid transport substrate-binding protein